MPGPPPDAGVNPMAALLLALAVADPGDQFPPVPLHALTVERARQFHGSTVTALVRVDKPPLTWDGLTLVGVEDQDDDTERGAVLAGEPFDIRQTNAPLWGVESHSRESRVAPAVA
jgi:hypothetical protein